MKERETVDPGDREGLWCQFGAALDMLENAMRACPAAVGPAGARRGRGVIRGS